ncbi:MAG: CD1845 family protein [Oscillospiraceae bacterium]
MKYLNLIQIKLHRKNFKNNTSTHLTASAYLKEKEVGIMRILLKILLFPITLALTIIVLVCQFLCVFSSMLLSIVAFLLFVLGLAVMVFIGEIGEGLKALFAAYLISPYGLPMLAAWLIGAVDGLNDRLKAI